MESDIEKGKGERGLILKEKSITWKEYPLDKEVSKTIVAKEGRFLSPIAEALPKEAQHCNFVFIEPVPHHQATERVTKEDFQPIVIMLPGTGESSFTIRLEMAKDLAEKYGYSSVLPTVPFLGKRSPRDQERFFIDSVESMALQSFGSMREAAALALFFLNRNKRNRVCLSGFSFGGAIASCASSMCLIADADGRRLACASYAGCSSPAVICDGAFSRMIDWDALMVKNQQGKDCSRDEMIRSLKQDVSNYLDKFSLPLLVQGHIALEKKRRRKNRQAAVCAAIMRDDQIICQKRGRDLIGDLQMGVSSDSDNDVFSVYQLPGGHVLGAIVRSRYQKMLIVEAMERIKEPSKR